MSRLLIVGAKGFIGSHAVRSFSATGRYMVYGCDVVTDYTSENYFQIDAANADYQEIFQEVSFDICINCSGAASVPDSLVHPSRDFFLNTVNVFKLLDAIRRFSPHCRFINLSSAAVYGNPLSMPVKEEESCKPVSPYGLHKEQAEMICKEFSLFFGIKTCSLRIFSAYGEGLKKQLFWDIANKARENKEKITLFGTGQESRDFVHVLDIVRVLELIIQKADFAAECYNVANGEEVTIEKAARLLLQHLQWDGTLSFQGISRAGDPVNWRADISKIIQMGYAPVYTIDKGLEIYVQWLRENKSV
jgi:UDP-glucose 4-epimerase